MTRDEFRRRLVALANASHDARVFDAEEAHAALLATFDAQAEALAEARRSLECQLAEARHRAMAACDRAESAESALTKVRWERDVAQEVTPEAARIRMAALRRRLRRVVLWAWEYRGAFRAKSDNDALFASGWNRERALLRRLVSAFRSGPTVRSYAGDEGDALAAAEAAIMTGYVPQPTAAGERDAALVRAVAAESRAAELEKALRDALEAIERAEPNQHSPWCNGVHEGVACEGDYLMGGFMERLRSIAFRSDGAGREEP